MTTQIEADIDVSSSGRWESLKQWLTAAEASLDYDPQEYTNARLTYLLEKTTDLETRIRELDRSD